MDNRLKFTIMDLGSRTPIQPEKHYGVYFCCFRMIKLKNEVYIRTKLQRISSLSLGAVR